jgi:hypothetical protein
MLRPVGELAVLLAELVAQPDSNFADSGDDFNRLFLVDLRDFTRLCVYYLRNKHNLFGVHDNTCWLRFMFRILDLKS